MKIIISFIIAFLSLSSFAQDIKKDNIPNNIIKQLPKTWKILDYVEGHLNKDNIKDTIIAVQNNSKDNPERKIMVFFGQADNTYILSGQSDKAILCEQCGGMMGDPYQDTTIENNKFTIHHYGGSAWRWNTDYTFAYSRIDKAWELIEINHSSFHAPDTEDTKVIILKPKKFGKIKLEDFNPEKFL